MRPAHACARTALHFRPRTHFSTKPPRMWTRNAIARAYAMRHVKSGWPEGRDQLVEGVLRRIDGRTCLAPRLARTKLRDGKSSDFCRSARLRTRALRVHCGVCGSHIPLH